ncbi:MAG: ATP-binding cassette domain-containing protein [Alphaproteobacteria bacterium]|nr:MAG: ATP-binding cassette domain-containing protein [Alphaproteobacteria bacterium]
MVELLRLESCSITREGRLLPVMRDISLAVNEGERLLISGASGVGKTTLALLIAGLLKPSAGRRIQLPPMHQQPAPIRMIFQDPFASMNPRWKVRDWLKDNRALPADLRPALDLCDQLELHPDLLEKRPLELSGGECQRFNLIGAMLGNPLLLILDEATSMVDKQTALAMQRLVEKRRADSGMAVVAIEHDAVVSSGQLNIQAG